MEEKQEENSVKKEVSEDFELPTSGSDEITTEITRDEFYYFIGDNASKYLRKFGKFYADGRDKFAFTWHWPAFLVMIIWMAYRKLYGWAIVVFFLSFIPFLGFLLWVIFGLTGNYLYYKHAKKKILKLKATQTFSDSDQMSVALRKIGGVNFGAMVIGIGVTLLQILFSIIIRLKTAQ
ncbi:MAG: DUF2628 domain-containing protein [Planctomycetota bacterium]|jgi:hypothetical protein